MTVAIGVVSVMPHASRNGTPYFFSYHSMNCRGMAEPATTTARSEERSCG